MSDTPNKNFNLTDQEIIDSYNQISSFWENNLKQFNVKLPSLTKDKKSPVFTDSSLVLVLLAQNYPNTFIFNKFEITTFLNNYRKRINAATINDSQMQRHLAAQMGWYIASGTRGDKIPGPIQLGKGEYKLLSLATPFPNFTYLSRAVDLKEDEWEQIKASYDYRCATCGSKEGQLSYRWPTVITKLEKGHMNPRESLSLTNTIPQCVSCNQADRNRWIYDKKGRVIGIANADAINKNTPIEVQKEIYEILKKKFEK